MGFSDIQIDKRSIRLHKCIKKPNFRSRTILVDDQWYYVDMWLKRNKFDSALVFWRQAEQFAKAGTDLPKLSSPLTRYYSALNAAKALLLVKGIKSSPYHGLTGFNAGGGVNLEDEIVKLQ